MARRHSRTKAIIFITVIATMNLMGISYGHWQQGMYGEYKIYTGSTNPCFADKTKVKKDDGFEKVNAFIKQDKKKSSNYIKLSGEIESGKDGTFTIDYSVFNNGNIPVKFDEEAFEEINKEIFVGNKDGFVLLESELTDEVLYPVKNGDLDKASKGSLTLQLETKKEDGEEIEDILGKNTGEKIEETKKDKKVEKKATKEAEEFEFEIKIPYRQWTGNW